jgi:23S rRNA (pseudouridine1915-N3)-methyltransferase
LTRLHICAVGRLRAGPERALLDDYVARADKTGRAQGLGPVSLVEVDDKRGGGMAAEAALL